MSHSEAISSDGRLLIGHDNPSGHYPAPVVPILAVQERILVIFATERGAVPVEVDRDSHFVRHDDELQRALRRFDPSIHRLFAFDAEHVILYEIAHEAAIFEGFLRDPVFADRNPFLRLSLAKRTDRWEVVRRELATCALQLQETPALCDSWYRMQREVVVAANPTWSNALPNDWRTLTALSHRRGESSGVFTRDRDSVGSKRDLVTRSGDITRLLKRVAVGDKDAEEQLYPLVYTELRHLARHQKYAAVGGQRLQTTAVVHEAYLRLGGRGRINWEDRSHFFAVAARAMRRVLVDYARSQHTEKSGGLIEAFDSELADVSVDPAEIISLDAALERLASVDARKSRIVELRYYVGLTVEEVAQTLEISPSTVKREWQFARAWLLKELKKNS